jgi:hypothetical protein
VIRRSACLALLALASSAIPARAQSITTPYDFVETSQSLRAIGAFVATDRGVVDIGPGSSYAMGLGYTLRISGPFVLDGRVVFMPTSRRVYNVLPTDSASLAADPRAGLELVGEADLSLAMIDASLRFDITGPRTWYRLQPFVLLGVGGVLRVGSDNTVETTELPENRTDLYVRFQNGFTGSIGAGIEWHASDRFTLVAEARDLLWQIDVPDGFFLQGRNIDDQEWVQTGHFSLGLAFRF